MSTRTTMPPSTSTSRSRHPTHRSYRPTNLSASRVLTPTETSACRLMILSVNSWAALKRNNIVDNTIFIFTSDNGCSDRVDFAELASFGHQPSYIFRGYKADIYEGGHRIPLIVRWPAIIEAGLDLGMKQSVWSIFLATCADILGDTLPEDAAEDSVSNLPLWRGETLDTSLREATIHSSMDGSLSIRKGRWKLEMCPGSGGWSYPKPGPECEGLPPLQLYDLDADIGERSNIAA